MKTFIYPYNAVAFVDGCHCQTTYLEKVNQKGFCLKQSSAFVNFEIAVHKHVYRRVSMNAQNYNVPIRKPYNSLLFYYIKKKFHNLKKFLS